MKNITKNLKLFILLLSVVATSCNKKNENVDPSASSSPYVLAFLAPGANERETEYLITKEDLMSGEISAEGTGIEQKGNMTYYRAGKTLFTSMIYKGKEVVTYQYDVKKKRLVKRDRKYVTDNSQYTFGKTNDEKTLLSIWSNVGGGSRAKLRIVDVDDVRVKNVFNISIYDDPESPKDSIASAYPTTLEVRGDKLFIPFIVWTSKYKNYESTDNAYVAVYDFPNVGSKPIKIIKDERTCNIGVSGSLTALIETDNGDIYSFSCGAKMAGFNPASSKPSGILRIPNGQTEFDPNYFFNIEEAANGGKLLWFDYVGGNKAIGRILTDDNGKVWEAFGRNPDSSFNQKLVIIDLIAKTVTEVSGVPLSAKRQSFPVLMENGKVYASIETATDVYIYRVDIATATAEKGAKVKGKTINGFFKL